MCTPIAIVGREGQAAILLRCVVLRPLYFLLTSKKRRVLYTVGLALITKFDSKRSVPEAGPTVVVACQIFFTEHANMLDV